jgi:hypothetical protein
MTEYAIKFHRSEQWSRRFEQAGIFKPPGMVISPHRFPKLSDVEPAAERINAEGAEFPCEIVVLK